MMRLAVLISGRGSNMKALIDACLSDDINAEVVMVASDKEAAGLEIARRASVPAYRLTASNQAEWEQELAGLIDRHQVDLICLAGFMRILSPRFVERYPQRIINIHPSLLPAYKGLNTHKRVLEDGKTVHGCTVHFVTSRLDDGPVIKQQTVKVMPDDNEESLAARVLEAEHKLYPDAIRSLIEKSALHTPRQMAL